MLTRRLMVLAFACALVPGVFAQPVSVGPAEARITTTPPDGLKPATNLSAQDRRDNFEALWKAVDKTYAHFELKSIDWDEIGRRYRSRLDAVASDDDFYRLIFRMIAELRDTHSGLQNYREAPLSDVPSVSVDLVEGRPFVVGVAPGSEAEKAGVEPGWEVTSVDGLAVADRLEAIRPLLRGFSSERAFRREATRRLLASEKATPASLVLRLPDGTTKTVALSRGAGPRALRPGVAAPQFELTRGTAVYFGSHPSGVGYIRILSFSGRDELDREFDAALDALRETPALVLDIRDNTGGFGHPAIVGRFFQKRTPTLISFGKEGRAHSALAERPAYRAPSGPWQYARPVALLVNDVTGSAADLFATELRASGHVTVVGSTTHGNLSGTAMYAVLPCNLVVRISNGYIADAKGRPIEVNGNVPDIVVEPTIADVLNRRDPVLERAISLLAGSRQVAGRGSR